MRGAHCGDVLALESVFGKAVEQTGFANTGIADQE